MVTVVNYKNQLPRCFTTVEGRMQADQFGRTLTTLWRIINYLEGLFGLFWTGLDCFLAEGVGFEPTRGLRLCRFSRPVHLTALPPFRVLLHDRLPVLAPTNLKVSLRKRRLRRRQDRGIYPLMPPKLHDLAILLL